VEIKMAYFTVAQDGGIEFRSTAPAAESVSPDVATAWAALEQLAQMREITDQLANLNRSLSIIAKGNSSNHPFRR
jgi:hypothetical protein